MQARMILSVYFLAILGLAVTACGEDDTVSESEKKERQGQAPDLSGRYLEEAAVGSPAKLFVTNEQGRHDIVATLDNTRGLTTEERDALAVSLRKDDPTLSDTDVAEVVSRVAGALVSVKLGEGATFGPRGGENVVLDGVGDLSEVALRNDFGVIHKAPRGEYALTASLFFTAPKGASRLDYRTTAATDEYGKTQSGLKGLFITLSMNGREVVRERQIKLGALVKY